MVELSRPWIAALVGHLDKAEASGLPGVAIGDQLDAVDLAVLGEKLTDFVFGCTEGQIAHVDPLRHNSITLF